MKKIRPLDVVDYECPECGSRPMIVDGAPPRHVPYRDMYKVRWRYWLLCISPSGCVGTALIPSDFQVIDQHLEDL